ncbi:hypothetical protein pb186bvf_001629 [Paramecium bursaria]
MISSHSLYINKNFLFIQLFMNQENLNDGSCRKKDHEYCKFAKFCGNRNCNDRMLCTKCDESGIHQNHENYDPKEIIYLFEINFKLEKYIKNEQLYLEQLEKKEKYAKHILENISIMFESFIMEIRRKKNEQTGHLLKFIGQQYMLEGNTINQDEIFKFNQMIGADNNRMNIDNLRQKINSIQNYVHDQFELLQNADDFVKNYRLQKLQDIDANLEKQPLNQELKNYNYQNTQLEDQFEEIYALDIAKSQEFIAVAVKVKNGFYLRVYRSQICTSKCVYKHDCKITSLRFCLKSKDIYFGDDQGYLNIYKVEEEKICSNIQIKQDMIDQILLVSPIYLLTICSSDKSILLTDLTEYQIKSSFLVGHYVDQIVSQLTLQICVQNIFDQEPFIQQELNLQTKLPLQLDISMSGDQILTCQGQEIKHWFINNEEKKLLLQNIFQAKKIYQTYPLSLMINTFCMIYKISKLFRLNKITQQNKLYLEYMHNQKKQGRCIVKLQKLLELSDIDINFQQGLKLQIISYDLSNFHSLLSKDFYQCFVKKNQIIYFQ